MNEAQRTHLEHQSLLGLKLIHKLFEFETDFTELIGDFWLQGDH